VIFTGKHVVPAVFRRQGSCLAAAEIPVGSVVNFHKAKYIGVEPVKESPDALAGNDGRPKIPGKGDRQMEI
jgi:hypothetical protein